MASNQVMSAGQTKCQSNSGGHGITFESRKCVLLFVRGYTRSLKDFKLEYQVAEAAEFDDFVFDDGSGNFQMFQSKQKISNQQTIQNAQPNQSTNQPDVDKKITHLDLFTPNFNTDYNLIKLVKAVMKANSEDRFRNKIKAAILVTNIPFDLKNDELSLTTVAKTVAAAAKDPRPSWYNGLTSITLKSVILDALAIFDMSGSVPDAKYYKFTDDPNIVQILQRQAVTIVNGEKKKKDKGLKLGDVPTEDQIRAALGKIIFAVKQPNVLKIVDIIKEEIKDHFKLNNPDTIYNALDNQFRDWCDSTKPHEQTSIQSTKLEQHVLTYADADTFFQKHVKVVPFGVTAPTDAFVGRVDELAKIKELLNESHNLIVSQTLTICGLGGIGKTQLAKQFIKEFGQSEFYRRCIWINAESDESVKDSFKQVVQWLNIQDAYGKDTEVQINLIFQYFEGLKVLLVFDNYDKSPINKGTLVSYCLEHASGLSKDNRPYFLITSKNHECLPKFPVLDLNVFSLKDAVQFIKNELIDEPKKRKNTTTTIQLTEEDAVKLAKTLECFPLALRQALDYIKQQHTNEKVFGERYDIQDYFAKFAKASEERKDLLHFKFPDDFGKTEKATYYTWQVTLEAIGADKAHGPNAIKVLRICSYLNANKIDPKMFLTLYDKEQTIGALLLLEKYSMITKIEQEKTTFYQIHRLVQAIVELQFHEREDKDELLEKTCELIYPELYEKAFKDNEEDDDDEVANLMKKCTFDQMLHYNTLSVHLLKIESLKSKYGDFFSDLNEKVLLQPIYNDEVEKIKALNMSTDYLKNIIESYVEEIMTRNPKEFLKYSIDVGALEVNAQINGKSYINWSIEKDNVQIFKLLIEKGADISNILEIVSSEMIHEIRNGKSDSIQIGDNLKCINECLFIATLFNQKPILEQLMKDSDLDLQYKEWPFAYVAAILGYLDILEIMVQKSDKENLYKSLTKLVKNKSFGNSEIIEMILDKYVELGGDVQDIYSKEDESFSYARHRQPKKEIFQFLQFTYTTHNLNLIKYVNDLSSMVQSETKNAFEQTSTSTQSNSPQQNVLTYADMDKFSRKMLKNFIKEKRRDTINN